MALTDKQKMARHRARERAKRKAEKLKSESLGFFGDFIAFVREQGVVGMAVGLAVGTAAGASVKTIVDEFINPLVALATRGIDLASLQVVIVHANGDKPEVAIGYGAIVSSLITLLATAFIIFWLVHVARLDRLDKKKE